MAWSGTASEILRCALGRLEQKHWEWQVTDQLWHDLLHWRQHWSDSGNENGQVIAARIIDLWINFRTGACDVIRKKRHAQPFVTNVNIREADIYVPLFLVAVFITYAIMSVYQLWMVHRGIWHLKFMASVALNGTKNSNYVLQFNLC